MAGAAVRLGFAFVVASAVCRLALACDSTGCLMVTRSAGGMLARKDWRLDVSFRSTDDRTLMSGSETVTRVIRPKVDFEHGLVRPGFHQDLGGRSSFLQVDAAYGLTGRTTVVASAPILSRRSYDIGHPPVLTETYETWGVGDTLVAVRHALVSQPGFSLMGGVGLELPTGRSRLVSPTALFDVGVLDPMLQPGSGSLDLVANLQGSWRLTRGGLDLTGVASYQANSTNSLDYRYGDDAIASLALAGPVAARLRASVQLKWAHRGRSEFRARPVASTGATVVYAVPGLVVRLPSRLSLYTFLPVPVHRYVNEDQLAPRLSLVVGVARTFR